MEDDLSVKLYRGEIALQKGKWKCFVYLHFNIIAWLSAYLGIRPVFNRNTIPHLAISYNTNSYIFMLGFISEQFAAIAFFAFDVTLFLIVRFNRLRIK